MGRFKGRIGVAVVAFLAAMAGTAVANHQFGDVPTSNTFHDAIDNFASAGCGTGFPGDLFKPNDAVKRQQMARFINACGGRVAYNETAGAPSLSGTNVDLATASITAGALEGGGFVSATTTVTAIATDSDAPDYPCELEYRLFGSNGDVSSSTVIDIDGPQVGNADEAASLVGLYNVPAGETLTVIVRAKKESTPTCPATVAGRAHLLLQYFPFDGNGDGGGENQ